MEDDQDSRGLEPLSEALPQSPSSPSSPTSSEHETRRKESNQRTQEYLREPEAYFNAELASFDAEANSHGVAVPSLKNQTYTEASCAECRDLQWLRLSNGFLVSCRCIADVQADRFVSAVAGERARKLYTFEAFQVSRNPTMKPALEAAKLFASEDAPVWLAIVGGTGIGKTHLAIAATREYVKRGQRIVYLLTPQLFDQMRAAMNTENSETVDNIMHRVMNTDLLVLDDYGMERETSWTNERLDTILVHRATHELPTLLTTNSAGVNSERIGSRMKDQRLCQLVICNEARDVRPRLRVAS